MTTETIPERYYRERREGFLKAHPAEGAELIRRIEEGDATDIPEFSLSQRTYLLGLLSAAINIGAFENHLKALERHKEVW